VDRIVFFAGVTSTAGGVFLFLYQGITYLMHNVWQTYTLYYLVDHGPESLRAKVEMSPQIAGWLQGCPLFIALLAVGLILLFIGSRLSTRYLN
jgi:hypothetical protein